MFLPGRAGPPVPKLSWGGGGIYGGLLIIGGIILGLYEGYDIRVIFL